MSATIGKVYVDAVITDERYKECMALVHEANERIDELRELIRDLWPRAEFTMSPANREGWLERMESLGVEVVSE